MDRRPIRIGTTAVTRLFTRANKQELLQRSIGLLRRDPVDYPGHLNPAHRRRCNADPDAGLTGRYVRMTYLTISCIW